jgi:hypothetical protein
MSAAAAQPPTPRTPRRGPRDFVAAGLPDPRPVTDYTVSVENTGSRTLLIVALDQPCVIGAPVWSVVSADTGDAVPVFGQAQPDAEGRSTIIVFDNGAVLDQAFNTLVVPYQDTQVRNFAGGFVAPGGRWFRPAK